MNLLPRLKTALPAAARIGSRTRTMTTGTGTPPGFNRWPLLLSPAELRNLPKDNLAVLDVSWHMPNSGRDADAEFRAGPRVPGARRFNLDTVAELDPARNPLGLTHMLPSAETFQKAVESLGITPDTHVVVYDSVGVFSAPRGVFTFKALGHDRVSALNGGLPRWIDEGHDVDTAELRADPLPAHPSAYPLPQRRDDYVRSYEDMVANSGADPSVAAVVLDARALPRFAGDAPEPRPGLPSGHIPHALPLPFGDLLTTPATGGGGSGAGSADGAGYTVYRPDGELAQLVEDAVGGRAVWDEIALDGRGLVFSCGSGMTACVGWLAARAVAERQGAALKHEAVYDESWSGYAQREGSAIATGNGDRDAVRKQHK